VLPKPLLLSAGLRSECVERADSCLLTADNKNGLFFTLCWGRFLHIRWHE